MGGSRPVYRAAQGHWHGVDIKNATKEELSRMMVGRRFPSRWPSRPVHAGREVLRLENLCVPSRLHKRNAVDHVSHVGGKSAS